MALSAPDQSSPSASPVADPRPGGATALRRFEERTRSLCLEAQMTECVDLLQVPDLLIGDVVESVAEVAHQKRAPSDLVLAAQTDREESQFIYPSRELFVQGDRCSFTCLATDLDFSCSGQDDADEAFAGRRGAIDYAAVTCESRPFPVLGFTQRDEQESAYPLLFRALASLIDLLPPRRFDLLDRDIYRGLLGPAPVFDLALVLWDDEAVPDARRPLCELTRDLAELVKAALREEPRFPPILNDIVCLRLNNKRFDGRLRYVWRV